VYSVKLLPRAVGANDLMTKVDSDGDSTMRLKKTAKINMT